MASKESREFHKYFDQTHNRDYFYEVKTGESHWEIPEDATTPIIVDKTVEVEEVVNSNK